jgi:cation:H+ antiporter
VSSAGATRTVRGGSFWAMLLALGLLAGLALLLLGAELLVRGASAIATGLGVPALLIGLTVVAYGTSAPELAVSVGASLAGRPELAVANVVGSNVFNILAIVGLSAFVAPLLTPAPVVRREIPLMLLATLAAMALGADGRVGRVEGLALLAALAWVTATSIRGARAEATAAAATAPAAAKAPRVAGRPLLVAVGQVALGLVLLVLGARWLVASAGAIATALGVSELVVGLTIVAVGTSLPELATSLVAMARGQRDLAIGNVVGSNVFNLLGILGLSAAAAPGGLAVAPQIGALDAWVMLGAAAVLLPMAWTGGAIVRWEGGLLLVGYVAYLVAVVQIAVGAWALPAAGISAILVALPVAALLLVAARHRRRPA